MSDFRKRRGIGGEWLRLLLASAGVLALAALAFMGARAAWGMYGKFAVASEAHQAAEAQLLQLKGQHERVEGKVDTLSSERGVEAEVRERYGLSRPGEGQITIVRPQGSTTAEVAGQGGFWEGLWSLLPW